MYGVENTNSQSLQACAMMRLRGGEFDALKFIVTGKAFSDFATLLLDGACLQSRHWALVRESLKHQGNYFVASAEP